MKHEKAMGFELRRMQNMTVRYIHTEMRKAGYDEVAVMNGWILGFLAMNRDKVVYQKDIEKRSGLARSTIANIMKQMEQSGYIERETDAGDTRLKRVTLTEAGFSMQVKLMHLIDSLHEEMETGITQEERECFYSVLEKIANNMQAKSGRQIDEFGI